jgi:hypothetical protein
VNVPTRGRESFGKSAHRNVPARENSDPWSLIRQKFQHGFGVLDFWDEDVGEAEPPQKICSSRPDRRNSQTSADTIRQGGSQDLFAGQLDECLNSCSRSHGEQRSLVLDEGYDALGLFRG